MERYFTVEVEVEAGDADIADFAVLEMDESEFVAQSLLSTQDVIVGALHVVESGVFSCAIDVLLLGYVDESLQLGRLSVSSIGAFEIDECPLACLLVAGVGDVPIDTVGRLGKVALVGWYDAPVLSSSVVSGVGFRLDGIEVITNAQDGPSGLVGCVAIHKCRLHTSAYISISGSAESVFACTSCLFGIDVVDVLAAGVVLPEDEFHWLIVDYCL